jgi:ribosome-associated protein
VKAQSRDGSGGLRWARDRAIPWRELTLRVSRSAGPGGQHVNKTSSKVEIRWGLVHSTAVTDDERAVLRTALDSRLDAHGSVVVVASDTRSQLRNRQLAEARLAEMVRRALTPRARRVPTKPSRAQKARRLEAKRKRSEQKAARATPDFD